MIESISENEKEGGMPISRRRFMVLAALATLSTSFASKNILLEVLQINSRGMNVTHTTNLNQNGGTNNNTEVMENATSLAAVNGENVFSEDNLHRNHIYSLAGFGKGTDVLSEDEKMNDNKDSTVQGPRLFDHSSGWNGTSYEAAISFCKKKAGDKLSIICPWKSYCPDGHLLEGFLSVNSNDNIWAPIYSESQPVWVSVGTSNPCLQRGSSSAMEVLGNDKIPYIMCCDKDQVDAASRGNPHVADYMERVRDSMDAKTDYCNINTPTAIDMNIALSCLRQTTPTLTLEYPNDAEAHMNEIRLALARWAQHEGHKMHSYGGYDGPWIENIWINHFEKLYDQSSNACVSDLFGSFIPILLPWVDLWVNAPNQFRYPSGLLEALKSVLRPNVPYITVSQNDEGLSGKNELQLEMFPNILVLSAGGYGHVPIPLFKQEEKLNNQKPVKDRSILLSYVGSLNTDRKGIRDGLHSHLIDIDKKMKSNSTASLYKYYKGGEWRSVMADSRFSLAPRGFGRTAYHLVETLQMGLIPIHFYSDVPWVPYADLGIIMVLNQSQIDGAVEELQSMTVKQIEEWEQRIVSLRQSHFSADGTMHQIENFMVGKPNDLRCQPLPPSIK